MARIRQPEPLRYIGRSAQHPDPGAGGVQERSWVAKLLGQLKCAPRGGAPVDRAAAFNIEAGFPGDEPSLGYGG